MESFDRTAFVGSAAVVLDPADSQSTHGVDRSAGEPRSVDAMAALYIGLRFKIDCPHHQISLTSKGCGLGLVPRRHAMLPVV